MNFSSIWSSVDHCVHCRSPVRVKPDNGRKATPPAIHRGKVRCGDTVSASDDSLKPRRSTLESEASPLNLTRLGVRMVAPKLSISLAFTSTPAVAPKPQPFKFISYCPRSKYL